MARPAASPPPLSTGSLTAITTNTLAQPKTFFGKRATLRSEEGSNENYIKQRCIIRNPVKINK